MKGQTIDGGDIARITTALELGDCLRGLRGRRTQQNVADHAKRANLYLHRPDVSTIERGRRLPTENELRGFLRACDRVDLFDELNAVRLRLQDSPQETVAPRNPQPPGRRWVVVSVSAVSAAIAVVTVLIYQLMSSGSVAVAPPAAGREAAQMPLPTCAGCAPGGRTFTEQAATDTPKSTFRDPRAFKGKGPSVLPGQSVEVVCRFLDPNAPLSVQPGWWYLIADAPWSRHYYTVANSYLNGDPARGPHVTPVDSRVPVC